MEEYFKQFMELLRFAADIASDEQRKIMRIQHGLTLDLLAKVGGDVYPTLDTIYEKVAFIYTPERTGDCNKEEGSSHPAFFEGEKF